MILLSRASVNPFSLPILIVLVFSFLPSSCNANDPLPEQISMRTNFCSAYQRVEHKEISRENALIGRNITIAIADEIDRSNPFIAIRVMDEISRRAGFRYIPYVTGRPRTNESWTQLLLRNTENFDVAAHKWDRTIERLSLGIIYPELWFDSDSILVSRSAPEEDTFVFWAFSRPFSPGLWILTVITMIFTGILYYILDFLHAEGDTKKMNSSIEGCIFTSIYSYTGSRSVFAPKSRATRLLTISMAFLYLILVSAYTANLTNYYVVRTKPSITINDVNDAVKHQKIICLAKGFANSEQLKSEYPKAKILEVPGEKDQLIAVSQGQCDLALISMGSFETYKRDMDFNQECDIEWIGRRIYLNGAGFGIFDSQETCSSLLDNVLDYYLLQIKREGVLDDIMTAYQKSTAASTCVGVVKEEQQKDTSLSVLNMGGAFAFHLCLIGFALLVGFYDYWRQPQEVKSHIEKELKSSVRVPSSLSFRNLNGFISEQTKCPRRSSKGAVSAVPFKEADDLLNPSLRNHALILKVLEKVTLLTDEKKELIASVEKQKKIQENLQLELREIKSKLN